jgi:preprotein translocase subunit SecY
LITLAGLAVYQLCTRLTVPGVDLTALSEVESSLGFASVIALGIGPFLTGFLLVEIFSFLLPAGRRLRREGTEGRLRLNRFAGSLSVLIAAMQAGGVVVFLSTATSRSGTPLVPNPGIGFLFLAGATFLAGVAVVFLIATSISRWGLGNGFCWLLAFGHLTFLFPEFRELGLAEFRLDIPPAEFIGWLVAVSVLLYRFARPEVATVFGPDGEPVPLLLPAFPQGLAPLAWAFGVLNIPWIWSLVNFEATPLAVLLVATSGLLLVFSWVAFHLFSSRKRLATNLPEGVVAEAEDPAGGRRWLGTTALLLLFGIGFWVGEGLWSFKLAWILGFSTLALLIAIGFDVVREWRFRSAHTGGICRILELDNVYLASYLRGRLETHGIDALVRTYHYRALFYFLRPLMKMSLWVPAEHLHRAMELVRPEEIEIV